MKIREVITDAASGDTTERWVDMPDVLTESEAAIADAEQCTVDAREERNTRLSACDWTQVSDVPLTDSQREAWAEYRQALRDITGQAGFPLGIVWPAMP